MELRLQIAQAISEALDDWEECGVLPKHTEAADAVLSIPVIAEALKAHERLVGKPNA